MESSFNRVMENFRTVSSIPRCSGSEGRISSYLVDFGKDLGLDAQQDEALNVIIKKPGAAGCENSPPVILQGHMDMVCIGNENNPAPEINPVEENGWLRAKGSTLGADNGIALAYIMTLLESDDLTHPPIEVLFTTGEETGMEGAFAIDPARFAGRTLINLDSEDEGVLIGGCAGGIEACIDIVLKTKNKTKSDTTAFTIRVHGLKGGHSGSDIHKQRANAIVLLTRILRGLKNCIKYNLVSFEGGDKLNAIPCHAEAVIITRQKHAERLPGLITEFEEVFRNEYIGTEPGMCVSLDISGFKPSSTLTRKTRNRILDIITLIPDGVQDLSHVNQCFVQTSCNLGTLSMKDDTMVLSSLVRSSSNSRKEYVAQRISCVAGNTKAECRFLNDYPEWPFIDNSPVRKVCRDVYRDLFYKEPMVTSIHAGLECGILSKRFPDVDMISLGPDIQDAHTVNEKMSIASARRTWEYIVNILKRLL